MVAHTSIEAKDEFSHKVDARVELTAGAELLLLAAIGRETQPPDGVVVMIETGMIK